MKKSMPEYISALSDNNYEILEEIMEKKFHKFRQLYWLIKDYSDYTSSLSYKVTKHDVLKVDMTLEKLKVEKVMEKLSDSIPDGANILIWNDKKVIHIEISKNEEISEGTV